MDVVRLDAWLRDLRNRNVVVHYDPATVEGFFLVPRMRTDLDLIREPRDGARLTRRRNGDVAEEHLRLSRP